MTDVQDNTDDETERLLAELEQQSQEPADEVETKPKAGKKKSAKVKKTDEPEPADEVETKPKAGKKKSAKAKKTDEPEPVESEPADEVDGTVGTGDVPSNVVTNTSRNPQRIKGGVIKVGEIYTLTDVDLADERLMKKIDRAVSLGILTRGTD